MSAADEMDAMTATLPGLERGRVIDLLDAMAPLRIAILGDLMLDRYLLGDVERISPEAPVPIVSVAEERSVPGGAANVAANILALGATPILAGVVGDDSPGELLRATLAALGIGLECLVTVTGRPTTTKTRILARGQQVVRIDREVTNPLPGQSRQALLSALRPQLGGIDVLVISDYDKGVIDAELAAELIEEARRMTIPVVVDPKRHHFFDYAGATMLTPNRRELDTAFGRATISDDPDFEEERQRLQVEHLLVTLGAEGIALASKGAPLRRSPSIAREVFDVSGAGDTVTAWAAAVLGAGGTAAEAAWLANLAAGVEVGKLGTATVSGTELLAAWDAAESTG